MLLILVELVTTVRQVDLVGDRGFVDGKREPKETNLSTMLSWRGFEISGDTAASSHKAMVVDIKLADKQAALEKLQWEAMTSNRKVEELRENLNSMQGEISSFMTLFEGLPNNHSTLSAEDYDVTPNHMNHLCQTDDWDETEIEMMEAARERYIAAVAAAKENCDEDSIAAAAVARSHLQSFIFRANGVNLSKGSAKLGF